MSPATSEKTAVGALLERTRDLLIRRGNEDAFPLRHVEHCFGLSSFEVNILLLCAAMELDSSAPGVCLSESGVAYPTFGLAFSSLPDSHWSATAQHGALRRWRLVELGAANSLIAAPLRVDEWMLHYLMGVSTTDDRIEDLIQVIEPPSILPASYQAETTRLARMWGAYADAVPLAVLQGNASVDKRAVAATAAATCGMHLRLVDVTRIPVSRYEREETIRLLERDTVLSSSVLLVENEMETARSFAERFGGRVAVAARSPFPCRLRNSEVFTVDRPPANEQAALWRHALGEEVAARCNGSLERASVHFSLDSQNILAAAERIVESGACNIWAECRSSGRASIDGLAQRVDTTAGWDDLVLPPPAMDALRAMTAQVRNRDTVLRRWGLAAGVTRGLGVSGLFHGQSGTGKTLAAEVIANELEMDLYRIDLSQVISKYIGETEKNLCSVFDAAENTGAMLLFDEADALFGKRSEVRDSHDRYANIEVGYLLQRMESYRGVALLTTNMRSALDTAFLRRIRFVVQFPFPDQTLRRKIWSRVFPPSLPTDGIDLDKLARLNVPGGNIRNIALSAAYMAAEANAPVRMSHLLAAARRECAKLDRSPAEQEIGGWV